MLDSSCWPSLQSCHFITKCPIVNDDLSAVGEQIRNDNGLSVLEGGAQWIATSEGADETAPEVLVLHERSSERCVVLQLVVSEPSTVVVQPDWTEQTQVYSDITEATMFASAERSSVEKRTLAQDDIDAVCAVYPPGDLDASCEAAPLCGLQLNCETDADGEPLKCTTAPGNSSCGNSGGGCSAHAYLARDERTCCSRTVRRLP